MGSQQELLMHLILYHTTQQLYAWDISRNYLKLLCGLLTQVQFFEQAKIEGLTGTGHSDDQSDQNSHFDV